MKSRLLKFIRSGKGKIVGVSVILFAFFWQSLPSPLFNTPTCTVLTDNNGQLLAAKIAEDGQWRFPHNAEVPEKFENAIIQFEDRHFYHHPGFNPVSFARAFYQNIKAGKIVSGGSTLTMQVIRLSRQGKPRTFTEKILEIILSIRLELSHSKKEILALYTSNAPFGGNVVGLDAAAWRYFGISAGRLSDAEIATLAVLPNAPGLIYPGRNQDKLLKKRNRLLDRLLISGIIDETACYLSKEEPLPGKPFPLPQIAPHLLTRAYKDGFSGKQVKTTLNANLQQQVSRIVAHHHKSLIGNGIYNAAALVLDVETGRALAYVGNSENKKPEHGSDVDVITAPRSTGSILKPFLFAAMLNEGELLPQTLIPDVPTQISGYSPKNYNLSYDGAVPAKRALARSLNIPAVRMLQNYGIERFHYLLPKLGLTTITQPAQHYGLSIILGGAEGTLWDLAGVYAGMSRSLNHFTTYNGKYNKYNYHAPLYVLEEDNKTELENNSILNAGAIYLAYEAMVEVSRPDEEANWKLFSSSGKIAWKTGTSFGYRDGWAIGTTPTHVVAVWVGNASGEGRPGLTGIAAAAPVLFDIFSLLKPSKWFDKPYDDLVNIPVCRQSGHRASSICEPIDSSWVPVEGLKTPACIYHKLIHLDATGRYQVNSDCEEVSKMIHQPWFILPPTMEWYYKNKNSDYKTLPDFAPWCRNNASLKSMELIYPKKPTSIYVPVEIDGSIGETVFEVAHRSANTTIYWHVDNKYMGSTTQFHKMGLNPEMGKHVLTLVDESGESLVLNFEILSGN